MQHNPGNDAAVADGRGARKVVPRGRLADWDPAGRARSALEVLFSQHAERDASLLPIRYGRMSASPWTYLRGAAAVMAADLALYPNTGLTVQLCGDGHVLNYGLWASPERNLTFDLRDFDETLPGPFEWDVKRLATSLTVCADENGLPAEAGDAAGAAAVDAYRAHMCAYAEMSELDVWYDRIDAAAPLASLDPSARQEVTAEIEKQATRRTSAGAFRKMTEVRDGRRRITEDPPFRVHLDRPEDAHEAEIARQVIDVYSATVPEQLNRLLGRFTLTDVVRQVVGVGSVGMRVYLVLAEGRSGEAPLFLQIKQAGASVYEQHLAPSTHTNHGQRVVVGQHLMQSATDLFAGWTRLEGVDFYVRQFRDMKIIPDGKQIAPYLTQFAHSCGHALAKAHARSGDPVAIAAYIGKGTAFGAAVGTFARAYADQTRHDHADLVAAISRGDVDTAPGW
ncbi:uncharacterized protein (DUF2252 family) [Rhodococcus sp. LBL1]|nr:uncharacterized protein (DUF2252 family) [Rhodococcus sp. LBL1]MDH6682408.1 uncharacterized protein (DUF2252 family) [Rhodococcus sp. LBL2]